MKIALQRVLRKMSTDFPTAAVGSSQAPTATVEKSQRLEHKNSDSPTLTGGFTGERPNTVVFVPSDAGEYEAQAKALNEQSQRILTAKADAEALVNAARQERDRLVKLGQLVSRMEHFSTVVNAQLSKPWVEKRYHDITAQMQEYLK